MAAVRRERNVCLVTLFQSTNEDSICHSMGQSMAGTAPILT